MNSSILLISHLSKVVLQFVDEAIPSELRECANRASPATRWVCRLTEGTFDRRRS
ncbi:MAG: hypothetical protein H7126_03305 [Candidatus Parcubacteria bacterium]|nr:hypothetical protein [Leptolyngbyaceae cyanobacterium LF-bin-113]